jgi:Holliday junction resolvasome RuvABC endonuclease subunit
MDFGEAVIGVDPASRVVGVCLLQGDTARTWSVRAAGLPLHRLYQLYCGVRELFDEIANMVESRPEVYVEEGMFGGGKEPMAAMPRNAAMAGEVRGVVLTEAWRHGWRTRKMAIQSWKALIPKEIRKMPKNAEYVAYWNEKFGLQARHADEIDSYFIARRAALGK